MSDPSQAERELEQLVDRALRRLPARRAPAGLEARVLREVHRRASLPWWRGSFSRWPLVPRLLFLVTCAALCVLAFVGGGTAIANLASADGADALSMPWLRRMSMLAGVASELVTSLGHLVPSEWIYGALAAGAVLYAALFGLGVSAYRVLYLKTHHAGDSRS